MVTGGCGYIGSHTLVDLINNGFELISVDNNSRSDESILDGVEKITGTRVLNYKVDLTDLEATLALFADNTDIEGVIHFAAFKSVPESVKEPLLYFMNNMNSLMNILGCSEEFGVKHFVFSSSCSVYGNLKELPVTENSPLKEAESPYARTKQIGEQIIRDMAPVSDVQFVLLRYFNPVGAHPSSHIGEVPYGQPENLVPAITQTAIGKMEELVIHGDDYSTRDGTCIRDYIHVTDIADAHTKALQYLIDGKQSSNYEIFNLGTGTGVTVLEAVTAFEKISGQKLNYRVGPRREGDVESIYANNDKAKEALGWAPQNGVEEMMDTAGKWEEALANIEHRTPNTEH